MGPGKIARYAQGTGYHDVLRRRLNQLLAWVQNEAPGCRGRGVVDTAPLLERDFARRAGLGWFGKNTMLLNKRLGSYFFLGALLLAIDVALVFHASKTGRAQPWCYIILMVPGVGALAYVVVELVPEWLGTYQ